MKLREPKTKTDKSKTEPPMSMFTAADNIKYNKYRNQMAMQSRPILSKEEWAKAGKPTE